MPEPFQLDELNPDNAVAFFIRELMDKYLVKFPNIEDTEQWRSTMFYSALFMINAEDEKKAMHYAQTWCDNLAGRLECEYAKTDSDWLKDALERKDGTKTNICRASEFEQVSDLSGLLYICTEDCFIEDNFSKEMEDTEMKRKTIQMLVSVDASRGEDPYMIMVAVHTQPIMDEV